jgi:hypothetical protein
LPSEWIHAIEAAAAVPVMNIGGMDQNGPFEPWNPKVAIDRPTIAHHDPMVVIPAMINPIVDTTQVASKFQRRSFMRSETSPHSISPAPPEIQNKLKWLDRKITTIRR